MVNYVDLYKKVEKEKKTFHNFFLSYNIVGKQGDHISPN